MKPKLASVLIVDDHPVNLKLAAYVLKAAGYQISEAGNATEALAVVQSAPPDLILMDIALPGMDGLTLTSQLKAGEATRHIKIAALTAFAMKGDDQKALGAGCDAYITKPIDTRKLPGQVAEILGMGVRQHSSQFPPLPAGEGRGESSPNKLAH